MISDAEIIAQIAKEMKKRDIEVLSKEEIHKVIVKAMRKKRMLTTLYDVIIVVITIFIILYIKSEML